MGKNRDPGSGIPDKHPGSATLLPGEDSDVALSLCAQSFSLLPVAESLAQSYPQGEDIVVLSPNPIQCYL